MSREAPARFCERRRVRFPPPTHLVAMCYSREQAEEVKQRLAAWLEPKGLAFNEEKTRIVHLTEGFCFLGFHIRLYRNRKLLIKPSKAAVKRIRKRLAAEMLALRGANAEAVISTLNPIIRGWAAYYRIGVSSAVFNSLDTYMWRLTYKWAKFGHQNKSKDWIVHRYFGAHNPYRRRDQWVFGDRASGRYLRKFLWTKIVRHQLVKLGASPDDPALADYWTQRRRKAVIPLIDKTDWHLLKRQNGTCPACGSPAHQPHRVGTVAAGDPQSDHPQGDRLHRGGHDGHATRPTPTRSLLAARRRQQ